MTPLWVVITVCLIGSPNYCKDLVDETQVATPSACLVEGTVYSTIWLSDNEEWELQTVKCTEKKPKEEQAT